MNEALMLRLQCQLDDQQFRVFPIHRIIRDFLIRSGITPQGWSFANYWGTPLLDFVLKNRGVLLANFTKADLLTFPSSMSPETLRRIQEGEVELKAVRAGDALTFPRGGKYRPTPVASLFHGAEQIPMICAGQFPHLNPYRHEFIEALNGETFVETSALKLFNLIRTAKIVTIGPSSLHVLAAVLGDPERVYYPPIGHLDINYETRGSLLARLVPHDWIQV
jgi:hypothetical protein